MKMYEVGGCVRDEILGRKSKDIDFSVVLEPGEVTHWEHYNVYDPFEIMSNQLEGMGFEIFEWRPQHLTVRAKFPLGRNYDRNGKSYGTNFADFVLARKEGAYTDGRRPDEVTPGTLMDDLARRDFTMNAIAKDYDGSYIDPFNGQEDITRGIIRAVGDPFERLTEDALRAVRAIRFSVTKGFEIDPSVGFAMESSAVLDRVVHNIADERIGTELSTMFKFNTLASIKKLHEFPLLTEAMFAGKVSLDSTLKMKGRGK